jgi:X-Pro dipeptidyl-peptidase
MFQGPHATPAGKEFAPLLNRFFDQTLLGVPTDVRSRPVVLSQTRDAKTSGAFLPSDRWPPAGTKLRLGLGRGATGGTLGAGAAAGTVGAFTDSGLVTEEAALEAPALEQGWQWYLGEPVKADTRIAGTPLLRLRLTDSAAHGHLAPVLVDVGPDGATKVVSRGFLDLRYRDGLATAVAVPPTPVSATVRLAPQDHVLRAGHKLGLLVAGSDAAWAVSDAPGATVTLLAGSELEVPVA